MNVWVCWLEEKKTKKARCYFVGKTKEEANDKMRKPLFSERNGYTERKFARIYFDVEGPRAAVIE